MLFDTKLLVGKGIGYVNSAHYVKLGSKNRLGCRHT